VNKVPFFTINPPNLRSHSRIVTAFFSINVSIALLNVLFH